MQNQCRVEHLLSAESWYWSDGDAAGSISHPATFFAFTAWLHAASWHGAAAGSPLVQRMPEPIWCSRVPTQDGRTGALLPTGLVTALLLVMLPPHLDRA